VFSTCRTNSPGTQRIPVYGRAQTPGAVSRVSLSRAGFRDDQAKLMYRRQLRHPVAPGLQLSQFILETMYTDLEQKDRVSPPTYKFLIALLLSAISHAVAMTLIHPGDMPAPAPAPLQLAILSMPAQTTGASTPSAMPDVREQQVNEQVPEHVPVTEPKPVIKRVKQPQPAKPQKARKPRPPESRKPKPHATPAPAIAQAPPTTSEGITVATSSRLTPVSESAHSMTVSQEVEYLYNPSPGYPPRARRLGLEGEVLIRTRVLPNGEPDELELAQSSGYTLLDQAAMKAVRAWRFRPALRSGELVASWIEIPVRFRLKH